jgi:hypothetical protein
MSIGANPPLFHLGQTGYDYWNNFSPAFQQDFGMNIGTGNVTESPSVNSLLQFGNGLISYGAVPTAYALSNGAVESFNQFGRASIAHNPGDTTSTQLSATAQAITGQSNLPYLPEASFAPQGYATAGDVPILPLGLSPNASNYVPTSPTSAQFF